MWDHSFVQSVIIFLLIIYNFDDDNVRRMSVVQIEGEGSGLVIRRSSPGDEARYTCVATNAAGNATVNINVQVICKQW